jgi:hypothetical protein
LIAVKTLAAIEAAMYQDQGAEYRRLLGELVPLASDAFNPKNDIFRAHLGASQIGKECGRAIWYSFRWATKVLFEGKMLRLFNRGHLEEPRMLALMKLIGVQVYQVDENGKQFRISKGHRGHGGGSMDSVLYNVPDIPATWMLGEFKTHGDKSFGKLIDDGLLRSKFEHYVQTQIYMGDQKLPYALYLATNKNTDDIHAEIIKADPAQFQRYQQRTILIVESREPPPKIAKNEADWRCKFCDHMKVCHLDAPPHKSCRTCQHAVILDDGKWGCGWHRVELTEEMQLAACDQYDRLI